MSTQYTALSPNDALITILRASNIPKFDWTRGPWYEEVPVQWNEAFPLCAFRVEDSEVEPIQGTTDFNEMMMVEVEIAAQQADIMICAGQFSDVQHSPIVYLDQFWSNPQVLSGKNFICWMFQRKSWVVHKDEVRGPDTNRVWVAKARYEMRVTSATIS